MPETLEQNDAENGTLSPGFNFTIEEARILEKYRLLSRHQQKGILQAIELIRPARECANPPGRTTP